MMWYYIIWYDVIQYWHTHIYIYIILNPSSHFKATFAGHHHFNGEKPWFPADFPHKSSHQDLILLFHRFAHPTERGGRLSCGELKQLLRAVQGDDETEPELPEGFPERLYEAWAPQGVPLKLGHIMTSGTSGPTIFDNTPADLLFSFFGGWWGVAIWLMDLGMLRMKLCYVMSYGD